VVVPDADEGGAGVGGLKVGIGLVLGVARPIVGQADDLMRRQGLYRQEEGGVKISGQVLYQAKISLPSSVQTGTYTAETFAIRQGKVVASAITRIDVRKEGFERFVAVAADRNGWLYGLFAVLVSVGMGWLAGRLFALV